MKKVYKVKLIKIKSKHRNLRTNTVEGFTDSPPMVGEPFCMWGKGLEFGTRFIETTPAKNVTAFDENKYEFFTENSSYRVEIEEVKEEEPK